MVSPPMLQLLFLPWTSTLLVVGSHCFATGSGCGWGSAYDEVVAVVPLIVLVAVVLVEIIEAGDR
jgi:hypothetical protein